MARSYDEPTKAAALAELATGASVASVSRKTGVSRSTLADWMALLPTGARQLKTADTSGLNDNLMRYLDQAISTLHAQLVVFSDPAYLKTQSAHDLAILHGVVSDKATRLLAALQPAGGADGDG